LKSEARPNKFEQVKKQVLEERDKEL